MDFCWQSNDNLTRLCKFPRVETKEKLRAYWREIRSMAILFPEFLKQFSWVTLEPHLRDSSWYISQYCFNIYYGKANLKVKRDMTSHDTASHDTAGYVEVPFQALSYPTSIDKFIPSLSFLPLLPFPLHWCLFSFSLTLLFLLKSSNSPSLY